MSGRGRASSIVINLTMLLACAWGSYGCGDGGTVERPPLPPVPTNNSMMTTTSDMADDMTVDVDGGTTTLTDMGNNVDMPVSTLPETSVVLPGFCDSVQDLGELSPNGMQTLTGKLADSDNLLRPRCGVGSNREANFAFTVAGPTQLKATISGGGLPIWVQDLKVGSCDEGQEVYPSSLLCSNRGEEIFNLVQPDETYFLSVEPGLIGVADYELILETSELECGVAPLRRCEGSQLSVCGVGFRESTFMCGDTGCNSGFCGGDSCDNLLEIDVSAAPVAQTITSMAGYSSQFNLRERAECFDGVDQGTNMPGEDVILKLTGVRSGQTIRIDASEDIGNSRDSAIFILDGCNAEAACLAGGDQLFDILEWTSDRDGDVYVLVDRLSRSDAAFAVEISTP